MTQYIRNHQFDAVQLDKEWIILNSDAYTVTKLNETGGLCWSLLSEVQTPSTLAAYIQRKYGYKQNEQEIEWFLTDLVKYGLVQYAG